MEEAPLINMEYAAGSTTSVVYTSHPGSAGNQGLQGYQGGAAVGRRYLGLHELLLTALPITKVCIVMILLNLGRS